MQQAYGNKVRIVFKDFPLPNHAEAFKASEAAHCAGDQGKYWEMNGALFESPARDVGGLVGVAGKVGLNTASFRSCLEGGKFSARVRESVSRMQALGVDSTPMFLIGLTPAAGQPLKVLRVVRGAVPCEEFKTALDKALSQ